MARCKVLIVLLGLFLAGNADAQKAMDEYQVKAAFLLNFTKFVEWPASSDGSAAEPFAICVLGRNPFGQSLSAMVEGKDLEGRPFLVRLLTEARQAKSCQILFITASERLRYRSLLAEIKLNPIFSVGETNDFLKEGGVATLCVENGKVQIGLNGEKARENNLRISSKLMSLARSGR